MINAAGDKQYFTSNRPAGNFKGNPLLSPLVTSAFTLINHLATTKFGISFFDGFGLNDVWVSYKVNGVWSEPQNLNDVSGEPPINTIFHDLWWIYFKDVMGYRPASASADAILPPAGR